MNTDELIYQDETYVLRGACFEVYKEKGCGFLEAVYQECLAMEFQARGLPFRAMPGLTLSYKGSRLRQTYSPDFICFESIIVELKAGRELAPEHHAQVFNYLKATGLRVGLLVNFGKAGRAVVERLVV